jgi:cytochrome c-type biogenesis protein
VAARNVWLVIDVPIALAVGAGMVATVNPCGFAMLPAYLGFFLGADHASDATAARVRRALVVSVAMTAGFVAVFGTVGLLVQTVASGIDDHLSKVTVAIGLVLVGLGFWLLTGHELNLRGPKLERGGRDRSAASMFVYGVSYAIASLSCTLGPFLVALTPTFRDSGVVSGLLAFVSYGVGMGLVVTAVTVALAAAQTTAVQRIRRLAPVVNRVSGALLVLAGAYVAWYGWWEIRGDFGEDPVVDRAIDVPEWLSDRVASIDPWVLVVLVSMATAAAILRSRGRRERATRRADRAEPVR